LEIFTSEGRTANVTFFGERDDNGRERGRGEVITTSNNGRKVRTPS